MSKKYCVELTKYERYEVEADSAEEALDKAFEICDADPYAWTDPVDESYVEEIKIERKN